MNPPKLYKNKPILLPNESPNIVFQKKRRLKYLKLFDSEKPKILQAKATINILKNVKYIHTYKSRFSSEKVNRVLRPSLKSIRNITIKGGLRALTRANLCLQNLISYNVEWSIGSPLGIFKYLRKAQNITLTFVKQHMSLAAFDYTKLITESKKLKHLSINRLCLQVPKAGGSDMMKYADIVPKEASLDLRIDNLALSVKPSEFDPVLSKKVQSLYVKSLTNSSLNFIFTASEYLTNLTHLHLGTSGSGALSLNEHSYYHFLSKLETFANLNSFSIYLKLSEEFSQHTVSDLSRITLPMKLEHLVLSIKGINYRITGSAIIKILQQLEKMEELRSLKLLFEFLDSVQNDFDDFANHLPSKIPKLKNLNVKITVIQPSHIPSAKFHTSRIFDWIRTHPKIENVKLSIPLTTCLDIHTKKQFDFTIENLRSLNIKIEHEPISIKDYFEDFIKFLSIHNKIRFLTLKFISSYNFLSTFEILQKNLQDMQNLEVLNIKYGNTDEIRNKGFSSPENLINTILSYKHSGKSSNDWFNEDKKTARNCKIYFNKRLILDK